MSQHDDFKLVDAQDRLDSEVSEFIKKSRNMDELDAAFATFAEESKHDPAFRISAMTMANRRIANLVR